MTLLCLRAESHEGFGVIPKFCCATRHTEFAQFAPFLFENASVDLRNLALAYLEVS
jgi:hypothetical protein